MERMDLHAGDGDRITLNQTRAFLREHMRGNGAICPSCEQAVKVYRRKLNSTLARALIQLYRHGGEHDFIHAPSLPGDTHEMSQASWWGLIFDEGQRREDGGRAGFWKLSERGVRFVLGQGRIEEHAVIYNGRCVALEGQAVSILDSLGARFDYAELMRPSG